MFKQCPDSAVLADERPVLICPVGLQCSSILCLGGEKVLLLEPVLRLLLLLQVSVILRLHFSWGLPEIVVLLTVFTPFSEGIYHHNSLHKMA